MDTNLSSLGGVVVFDSNCALCSTIVRFLISIDKKKKLRFTTFDSRLWDELSKGYNGAIPFLNSPGHSESLVFYQFNNHAISASKNSPVEFGKSNIFLNQNYYFQSDAVIKIIETLSFPWNLLKGITIIPRNLREKAYRIIARNRFNIFGKKTSCALPTARTRERYIL